MPEEIIGEIVGSAAEGIAFVNVGVDPRTPWKKILLGVLIACLIVLLFVFIFGKF
ncbi:hypothetical protein HZC31_02015 [Candidatus Woesearchaeota archaeon]|nr:hypothetical protein [Candidatus Woesearchaeota archaeon]